MSFLAPLFFAGLAAIAVPIIVHLIQRERKDIIEFPSLMFIRKIPYQSVERRRIHNWPLLLLRAAAMALLVAAFARPFFEVDPVRAAAATSGAREVVILLDRSASMGYGNHWTRAQDEAKKIAGTLSGEDRATLVAFGTNVEEVVRATGDQGRLQSAIGELTVTSEATRYARALRLGQSLLSRSTLPRKEAYLISDFQKSGWARQEEISMPEGATITPVSVAELETSGLAISSISLARASFAKEERVTITAGVTNRSAQAVTKLPVSLEIDGRPVGTREVTVGPNASGAVTFDTVTVAESNMRGTIRAGTDALPKDNVFHFVLSPSRPVSVLVIAGEAAPQNSNLYLTTALGIGTTPPFITEVVTVSRVTSKHFEGRSAVILNDSTAVPTATSELLKRFVEQGGGLLMAVGQRSPFGDNAPLVPGKLGAPIERSGNKGGTLGFLDYSHPVFEPFKDPRNGNFANVRFFGYRALTPAETDKVLARFDDGAVAMAERKVGSGRVIAFTSPLDDSWSDFPVKAMYLPLLRGLMGYLAQYQESESWHTVGRTLDIATPIAAIVREGQAGSTSGAQRVASGVVVAPSGAQTTLGEGGAPSIELAEQGFYQVRLQGLGDRRPYSVAVNLDPAESDLSALSPAEFLGAATGGAAVTTSGQSLERPEATAEDVEKKQAIWWFLLLGGIAALILESALSNRLSRRFGAGLVPGGTAR
jgi:hypothetical protein